MTNLVRSLTEKRCEERDDAFGKPEMVERRRFLDFCHYRGFSGGNTKTLAAFHTFGGREVNIQSCIS